MDRSLAPRAPLALRAPRALRNALMQVCDQYAATLARHLADLTGDDGPAREAARDIYTAVHFDDVMCELYEFAGTMKLSKDQLAEFFRNGSPNFEANDDHLFVTGAEVEWLKRAASGHEVAASGHEVAAVQAYEAYEPDEDDEVDEDDEDDEVEVAKVAEAGEAEVAKVAEAGEAGEVAEAGEAESDDLPGDGMVESFAAECSGSVDVAKLLEAAKERMLALAPAHVGGLIAMCDARAIEAAPDAELIRHAKNLHRAAYYLYVADYGTMVGALRAARAAYVAALAEQGEHGEQSEQSEHGEHGEHGEQVGRE